MKKEKNIQLMRGTLILFVVTQHMLSIYGSSLDYLVARVLYCIDIETFFAISGFLYFSNIKKYRIDGDFNFFLKKIKELLLPYIIWTLILDIIIFMGLSIPVISPILMNMGFKKYTLIDYLLNMIFFRNCYIDTLWFIYVLFICFLLYHYCLKWIDNRIELLLCFILAIGITLTSVLNVFIIKKIFTGLIAFGCGCCIALHRKKFSNLLDKHFVLMNLSAVAVFVLFFFIERTKMLFLNSVLENTYEVICVYIYTICSLVVISSIASSIPNNSLIGMFLTKFGDYSYSIYLIHNPYLIYPSWFVATFIFGNSTISRVLALLLSFAGSMIISSLIEKVNLGKYLVGKKVIKEGNR